MTIAMGQAGTWAEGPATGFPQGLFEESSTQLCALGSVRELSDGRKFAYAQAGEALYAGLITQSAAPDAYGIECLVQAAAAVGDKHIHITYGAGATATANYYREGYIASVKVAVYPGPMYKVRSHLAMTSGATVQVELYDAVREALTTACYISMVKNPQHKVISTAGAAITAALAGVPPIDVTTQYYFWNQVKGMCCVVSAGTEVIGDQAAVSATAGAVMPAAAITDALAGAYALTCTDTWHTFVMLSIPGY